MRPPKDSPWGSVQQAEKVADGIWFVYTAGHGGIWLDPDHQERMPACKNFLNSKCWWEEDCDWAIPYLVFQDEIRQSDPGFENHRINAVRTVQVWHPEFEIPEVPQ
jgi:hypothetical protein